MRFHVDSFPDRTFEAKVRFIAPVVTNDTRSMVVEAVVPNPDGDVAAGAVRHGRVGACRSSRPRFSCPLGAVQKTGEVARVFVVRDGVAREQVVALGEVDKGKVEIRSGLTGKETARGPARTGP